MNQRYKFNPEDFGYESVKQFPELIEFFGPTTFIKVIAKGDKKMMGRAVYWYSACHPMSDDSWKILSGSYDENEPDKYDRMSTDYCGLISNHQFSTMLLKHLFGTCKQESVEAEGAERLKQNINQERFS